MSAWSTKIFGNDLAQDLKSDFVEMLGVGMDIGEIEEYLLNEAPEDSDELACSFWTSLAALEWDYGILNSKVKEKAKNIIKNNSDDELFLNVNDKKKRRIELENLYNKLDTVNPNIKKIRPAFIYRTPWNVGDIFALEINSHYVYIIIAGIQRNQKKIECLSTDSVFIKVFDLVTNQLLNIKSFKRTIFKKIKYKKLNNDNKCNHYVEQIWCLGKREKNNFEKNLIYIGNKRIISQYNSSVSIKYQFKELKNTMVDIFKL